MFTVVITEKGGSQKRLSFEESEVTIGRVPGNDIVLPKGNVSKRHSRIVLKDNRFIVVDLKSTNGTYVNGRKITSPLVVRDGDKIYIGDFIITLEDAAADTADAAPSTNAPGDNGASAPPPLPSRAPEPMGDEVVSALMRPAPPNAALLASGPPTGTASIVSVPPVLGGLELAEPEPLVERTQAQAQMPSGVARHTEAESRAAEPVRVNGRSAGPVNAPPKPPERRSMPPVLSVRTSSLPPAASADLRSLMARLARELDVDNTQPSAVEDEGRWRKAERVIETHIGELAKNGTLPPSIDKRALAVAALHEAVGLGPLDALLDDASVCEIIVERFDRIRVGRGEGLEHGEGEFSSVQALLTVMRRLCAQGGVSEPKTSCDLSLPSGLHVVAVFAAAATDGPVLSVRRRPPTPQSLEDLQEAGVLDDEASEAIASELEAGRNVLIVGEPGTALATFVGALIAGFDVDDRVALLERAPDVPLGGRSAVALRRAEAELDELLSRVAYLGKARLVLHELKPTELGRALEALGERRDGALASAYAPTLDSALARLRTAADGDLARVTDALPFVVHLTLENGKTRVARASKLKVEGEKLSVGD